MSPLTLMGVFVELLLVNLQTCLAIRHHFPGGIDLSTKELCEHFENSDDVNELNELINCEAHYVMDTYIPKINILVRSRIITNIKTNIRKRNRAYKKSHRLPLSKLSLVEWKSLFQ
jgi:hypothetical protein